MWKLTIEDDEGKQTLLPLARDEYSLGRDEGNTIRLTERNISRKHATLRKAGVRWSIEDHASYNGSYINGQRVAGEADLANADVVQIGDYRFFVTDDAADSAGAAPAASERCDRILLLSAPEPGREFPLVGAEIYTIGREADCAVSVNHPSVSRVHAEIRALGAGRFEMLDRGSSNGVRVNGVELRRALLEGGDLIELGDVKLRFLEKGQVVRLGADVSQQIAVTAAREASLPPGMKKSKTTVYVGVGLAVVALLGGVGVLASRGGEPESGGAAATADDPGKRALDLAKKAVKSGDYDGAVAELAKIPEGNPARHDPEFAEIHGLWADALIKRATTEDSDPLTRKELLTKVAQSMSVDAGRRSRAADELAKLTAGGTAVDALPTAKVDKPAAPDASAKPATTATTAPGATAAAPGTAEPPGPTGAEPVAAAPKKKDDKEKKDAPAATGTADPTSADGAAKVRKQLEGKVFSGRGTPEEIKMLRAICRHQGDRACADRARAMMDKLDRALFSPSRAGAAPRGRRPTARGRRAGRRARRRRARPRRACSPSA
ncbi:MAG: FHA domain-containing protein [Polyangiaceae bacterium]|nr:FHA domain-containing protein [Polyangiaceae bacterium]